MKVVREAVNGLKERHMKNIMKELKRPFYTQILEFMRPWRYRAPPSCFQPRKDEWSVNFSKVKTKGGLRARIGPMVVSKI